MEDQSVRKQRNGSAQHQINFRRRLFAHLFCANQPTDSETRVLDYTENGIVGEEEGQCVGHETRYL